MVAPAAIERTRQGLDDIGDSLFSFRLVFKPVFKRAGIPRQPRPLALPPLHGMAGVLD
jgi:hypothetical protein